jgi:hypothetical protein
VEENRTIRVAFPQEPSFDMIDHPTENNRNRTAMKLKKIVESDSQTETFHKADGSI